MFCVYLHINKFGQDDVNTTSLSRDNYEFTKTKRSTYSFPSQTFYWNQRFSCQERKHFDFLASADTNALSLHMIRLSVDSDQPIANSATFPSQKTDVTLFQLKWPMKQISKTKSTFKNTIYRPIASSLVS